MVNRKTEPVPISGYTYETYHGNLNDIANTIKSTQEALNLQQKRYQQQNKKQTELQIKLQEQYLALLQTVQAAKKK